MWKSIVANCPIADGKKFWKKLKIFVVKKISKFEWNLFQGDILHHWAVHLMIFLVAPDITKTSIVSYRPKMFYNCQKVAKIKFKLAKVDICSVSLLGWILKFDSHLKMIKKLWKIEKLPPKRAKWEVSGRRETVMSNFGRSKNMKMDGHA